MFSYETHYMISKEQQKDLQRAAERHQLIKIAQLQQPKNRGLARKMAGWVGPQMIKWGSKLQNYNQVQHQTAVQRGS
jgi:hypothetical protein